MASDKPLVSIVLPTHNGARYLKQAITSCIGQSYTLWELIIVDDASTDNTAEIIAAYQNTDVRIKSVRHHENKRLPAALNNGFAIARGRYYTWISDDNCFRDNAIGEMVKFLEDFPEVDVVYADYSNMDEDGNAIAHVTVGEPDKLFCGNCIGACFLYKKEVHQKLNGYAEDLFLAEDYDFWLRAYAIFTLRPLHRDLYRYRIHSASLTSKKIASVLEAAEQSLKRNLPKFEGLEPEKQVQAWINLVNIATVSNQHKLAFKYMWLAFCSSPVLVLRTEHKCLIRSIGNLRYLFSVKR